MERKAREFRLDVDTNDYDYEGDSLPSVGSKEARGWDLFGLKMATFQDWEVAGETGYWTVDGETFCGTRYSCTVEYADEVLEYRLIQKIMEYCNDRYIHLYIDNKLASGAWDKA